MKKKILFMAPSLSIGGAERVLVNLLKEVNFAKYDITLCLYSNAGVYFSEIPQDIKLISIFNNHFFSRLFSYLNRKGFACFIKFFVKRAIIEDYDVGICFSDGLLTDVLLMAEKRFKKTLTWVHSCYMSQETLRKVYTPRKVMELKRNRYGKLTGVVFVSKNSQKEFEQLFGRYPNEYCVYNLFDFKGIAAKAEEKVEIKNNAAINFVAIGRLVKVKAYDKLIEAAKILSERGLDFCVSILGDGPQRKFIESKIQEYGLEDKVRLLGFKSNPYPYLKQSDVLVLTSSSEALPTVLVEAMYFSKPIVATKCSGCMEITDEGKYALLTEHTAEDIADKMELVIRDKNLRLRYGKLASERCEHFNENKTLGDIYKIFDSL